MATSPIEGIEAAPEQPGGTDIDTLGPSDSSDSGSDTLRRGASGADMPDDLRPGSRHGRSTSDAAGTGERAAAGGAAEGRDGADIAPDRVADLDAVNDDRMTESVEPEPKPHARKSGKRQAKKPAAKRSTQRSTKR